MGRYPQIVKELLANEELGYRRCKLKMVEGSEWKLLGLMGVFLSPGFVEQRVGWRERTWRSMISFLDCYHGCSDALGMYRTLVLTCCLAGEQVAWRA